MSNDFAKQIAGAKAVDFIQDGMIVGLGTGSTAYFFIKALSQRVKEGLKIETVASSKASFELAKASGITVRELDRIDHIDVTIDGADEVDSEKRMIKGAGGALVREKILASNSNQMIVIIDSTKLVKSLGKAPLPIEIIPFGSLLTQKRLENLNLHGKWRKESDKKTITENGNYLLDIHFPDLLSHPEEIEKKIKEIPGVVDTGFFFNLAKKVIVGYPDGKVSLF